MRGLLVLIAAGIGFASVAQTLANVIVKIDPARAHALSPSDGRITANVAEQQFGLTPVADPNSRAAQLARLALRQDATAVKALSVLGLQAQMRQEIEQARQLFTYSQALSRRELRPQIWAIEEAVSRGDIGGALEQYDIALRTSRTAPDLLFPVLSSAVAEPRVRAALIADLAQQPVWSERFLLSLATTAPDPEATVRFFREAAQGGVELPIRARASLVDVLVARQLHAEGWAYYSTFRSGADRRRSRDPGFSLPTDVITVFDWVPVSGTGVSATIQPDRKGGLVDFSAAPSSGGMVLRQMQVLPPGSYRLEGRSSGVEQPERSLPYWSLTCQDGRELGRVPLRVLPASGVRRDADALFSGRFMVPANCPVQMLALMIRPSDEITGVSGQIHRAQLAQAR